MALKIILYFIIFILVSAVAYVAYPFIEKQIKEYQRKKLEKISPKLNAMFLEVPHKKLILIDILAPVACGALGYILTNNWLLALVFAVGGLAVPNLVVKRLGAIRQRKFANQLVDGLMILSSSLKAGLSLLQALEALVEEMPAPLSQEFSLVIRQVQMGVPLEDALAALKKRMRVDDLDMVVTAINVSRETGGNLTDILSQVAYTIRERNKLLSRVNALTVQGKMQGAIMSLLPIAFGIFVNQFNPGFFNVFLNEPMGRFLLAYAAISEIVGVFFIIRFSGIEY